LRAEEECVTALTGFELLYVIRRHGVKQALAVFAERFDPPAPGQFEQSGVFQKGVQHDQNARSAADNAITANPDIMTPFSIRARFSGVVDSFAARIDTAAMCSTRRNFKPKTM